MTEATEYTHICSNTDSWVQFFEWFPFSSLGLILLCFAGTWYSKKIISGVHTQHLHKSPTHIYSYTWHRHPHSYSPYITCRCSYMCLVSQSHMYSHSLCDTHTILHAHLLTCPQVPEVREQIPNHTHEHAHTQHILPNNECLQGLGKFLRTFVFLSYIVGICVIFVLTSMIIILKLWINMTKIFVLKMQVLPIYFFIISLFISHFCHPDPKINYKTVYYSIWQHMSDLLTLFPQLVIHMVSNCINTFSKLSSNVISVKSLLTSLDSIHWFTPPTFFFFFCLEFVDSSLITIVMVNFSQFCIFVSFARFWTSWEKK